MISRILHIVICLMLSSGLFSQQQIQLIGRNVGWKTLPDGNSVRVFGFAPNISVYPNVPGPTLEFTEGDSVIIDFWNISQGAPHTIHLHGLDVNQENDGVPHLSFEVHHMEHGYYRFRAPQAGTYLYHCHVISAIHVQAGMYGLIKIHPPSGESYSWEGGYEIHRDISLLTSEFDTVWHNDTVLLHDYDTNSSMHQVRIPEYHPQHFLVNGLGQQQLEDSIEVVGQAHENIYIRLANIGNYMNRVEFPESMKARIVSSDGRPLDTEEPSDTVEVYPGERFGVLCQPTTEFESQIAIEYADLNTRTVHGTEVIDVIIDGYLGIQEAESPEFSIAPIPASDQLTITFAEDVSEPINVELIDLQNRKVNEFVINSPSYVYDVSSLPAGTYFFYFKTDKSEWTSKWVKTD